MQKKLLQELLNKSVYHFTLSEGQKFGSSLSGLSHLQVPIKLQSEPLNLDQLTKVTIT